jgi:hypothetical protein
MTVIPFRGGFAPPPTVCEVSVERQPLRLALDWQREIVRECGRHRVFNGQVVQFLEESNLLRRCSMLSTDVGGGPLKFRFVGRPALDTLGEAWGRMVLNKPEVDDPHCDFATAIGEQYVEAIESGEPLVNKISVTGVGQPFSFTHALIGWQTTSRRAILSAVKMHDVAGPRRMQPVQDVANAA